MRHVLGCACCSQPPFWKDTWLLETIFFREQVFELVRLDGENMCTISKFFGLKVGYRVHDTADDGIVISDNELEKVNVAIS